MEYLLWAIGTEMAETILGRFYHRPRRGISALEHRRVYRTQVSFSLERRMASPSSAIGTAMALTGSGPTTRRVGHCGRLPPRVQRTLACLRLERITRPCVPSPAI